MDSSKNKKFQTTLFLQIDSFQNRSKEFNFCLIIPMSCIDFPSNLEKEQCVQSIKPLTEKIQMSVGQWEWWKFLNNRFYIKSKSKQLLWQCAQIKTSSTITLRTIIWTACLCWSSLWMEAAWLKSSISTWKKSIKRYLHT